MTRVLTRADWMGRKCEQEQAFTKATGIRRSTPPKRIEQVISCVSTKPEPKRQTAVPPTKGPPAGRSFSTENGL